MKIIPEQKGYGKKQMNNIQSIRKDWDLIESLIDDHSSILDIGCGEGGLIQQLLNNRLEKSLS